LKIIQLHSQEKQLIEKAAKQNSDAQQKIYELYAPKMLQVCRQYTHDSQLAEDLMISAFLKVFTHLKNFEHKGSFEGWIRKIVVNVCISEFRKNNPVISLEDSFELSNHSTENLENTGETDLQKLIDALPTGYKIVFNLFAIEGYSHAEIAKRLDISESTSKSQLFKARKWLQAHYLKQNNQAHGNK
jgi:RNA polymerase sigma factor (sigma-70 family)